MSDKTQDLINELVAVTLEDAGIKIDILKEQVVTLTAENAELRHIVESALRAVSYSDTAKNALDNVQAILTGYPPPSRRRKGSVKNGLLLNEVKGPSDEASLNRLGVTVKAARARGVDEK